MKIAFPEIDNPIIREAIDSANIEAVGVNTLGEGCKKLHQGVVEGMIAGIDTASREVILECRQGLEMTGSTFSGAMIMSREKRGDNETYIVADVAACKHPSVDQLREIIYQTWETAKKVLDDEPRVAILSFSTMSSGGIDDSLRMIQEAVKKVRDNNPDIVISGEVQLDVAVNSMVAEKKLGQSNDSVGGKANVLIVPDLNSGNILYKAMEQFGGFTAAGPILQGFDGLVSDLSRGSTVQDVVSTIEVMKKIRKG